MGFNMITFPLAHDAWKNLPVGAPSCVGLQKFLTNAAWYISSAMPAPVCPARDAWDSAPSFLF